MNIEAIAKVLIVAFALIGGGWQMILARRHRKRGQLAVAQSLQPLARLDTALMIAYPVCLLAWLIRPGIFAGTSYAQPEAATWIGTALFGIGGLLWLWTQACMGRLWSDLAIVQPGHTVLKHGPYAVVRHPMYLSFWIMAVGGFLATHTLAVSLPFLLHVFVVSLGIPGEERILMRHVDGYGDYALAVPDRLIPGLY